MIKAGCPVNWYNGTKGNGCTPLVLAASKGQLKVGVVVAVVVVAWYSSRRPVATFPAGCGRCQLKAIHSRPHPATLVHPCSLPVIAACRCRCVMCTTHKPTNTHHNTPTPTTPTPLLNHQVVRALLAAGADPDLPDKASGQTPLHYAASNGHMNIIEDLLSEWWLMLVVCWVFVCFVVRLICGMRCLVVVCVGGGDCVGALSVRVCIKRSHEH